jgi:hypothetical protein
VRLEFGALKKRQFFEENIQKHNNFGASKPP